MSDLIVLEEINAVTVFETEGGADPVLSDLKKAFKQFTPDVTTSKGRKEIASYSRKFSTTKVAIVGEHDKLVLEAKERIKKAGVVKKLIVTTCDDYRDRTRQPLTDYENAKKEREAQMMKVLNQIQSLLSFEPFDVVTPELLDERIAEAKAIVIDESFGEKLDHAISEQEGTIAKLSLKKMELEKYIAEQEELAILKKEKAERVAKELQEKLELEAQAEKERIAKEKAEHEEALKKEATLKAEQAAKAETVRVEREKQEAIEAQQEAERQTQLAEKEAARQAEEAEKKRLEDIETAKRETEERLEKERLAAEAKAEKLADNKAHRTKVNKLVASTLAEHCGMDHEQITNFIEAENSGELEVIFIKY